ncbi:hypothetical protein AVEN_214580-1 [Araneus ventricosus]|uniref:Uncharacterized protein n=1 Tax=Araneus ventricosus TaxID=182803 RepID=A0A4Y2ICA5_ARAVE|nr:hypothetical protein AVEN_214580-1 [Araneus ventricosus]
MSCQRRMHITPPLCPALTAVSSHPTLKVLKNLVSFLVKISNNEAMILCADPEISKTCPRYTHQVLEELKGVLRASVEMIIFRIFHHQSFVFPTVKGLPSVFVLKGYVWISIFLLELYFYQ